MLRMLRILAIITFAVGLIAGFYLIPSDQVNSETGNTPLYAASLDNTTQYISGKGDVRTGDDKGGGSGNLVTCELTCGPTCNQTTCGATCVATCDFTCTNTCEQVTCAATCVATCEATCANTCSQPTCESTCVITCSYTCEEPITLSYFGAQIADKSVNLTWTTASEIGTYCYKIYRSTNPETGFVCIADYIEAEGGLETTTYEFTDGSAQTGVRYYYQLADVSTYGTETRHTTIASALIPDFRLEQNFPNPFNPETTIRFRLVDMGQAELAIFDVSGRKVRTLVNGMLSAGSHEVSWNATDDSGNLLPSGMYVYRLTANGASTSGKMIYMK